MSKEKAISKMETTNLTKQWKKGTLKSGYYYFEAEDENTIAYLREGLKHPYNDYGFPLDNDVGVLAPVPDYDQFVELTEKANLFSQLVTKCNCLEKENSELVQKIHILNEANMSLENTVGKLGEQLNEANKVVKFYADSFCGDKQEDGTYLICTRENALGRVDVTYNPNIANNYLEKRDV
jgi:hypothetical protein